MRAVVIDRGNLRWEERPDPEPGDNQLVVAVAAAGVNGADLVQRRGRYPAPPGWPQDVPGMELAGTVAAVGDRVTRFAPGDRVMGLVGGGGQATAAVVDETAAVAVPPGTGWPEAGGFPEVFATAHDALFTQGELAMGDRVLVTGAAGGVGVAGVQLAACAGATVVASVRDPARREAVAQLGAAVAVDPADVAAHGPYDVVLELVGAPSLDAALGSMAAGGRAVVIGVGGGSRMELDLFRLMAARARIAGSTLRSRSREEKAAVVGAVEAHVLPLLAEGRLRVPVCDTFPMAEAAAAYERFGRGSKLGKVVLVT